MNRPVLNGVLKHLLEDDLDLAVTDMCPDLLRSVGSAIADMFLDQGYQLVSEFQDGRDLVQSYFSLRTGQALDLLGVTMVLNGLSEQMPVSLLVRCDAAASDSFPRAGNAVRFRGTWYRQITAQTTIQDVVDLASGRPEALCPFTLPVAA